MLNPVFNLLKSQIKIVANSYKVTNKKTQNNVEYFLLEPKNKGLNKDQPILHIDGNNYTPTDFHLSVYADLSTDSKYLKSSYHLTIELVDKNKHDITARIYCDQYDKIQFIEVKDSNAKLIPVAERETIAQFAKTYTANFSALVWKIYDFLHQHFNKKYTESLAQLTEKSKYLDEAQLSHLNDYQQQLEQVIAQLMQWNKYALNPHSHLLRHFEKLKVQITNRLAEAQMPLLTNKVEPIEYKQAVNDIQPPLNEVVTKPTLSELAQLNMQLETLKRDKKLSEYKKIVREHTLLHKKFELAIGDEALNCIVRCQELESQALLKLREFLESTEKQKKVSQSEVAALVKLISYIDPSIFELAVSKDKTTILSELLVHHKYININMAFTNKKLFLLDIAYEKKYINIFKLLLQHGAFIERRDEQGKTLLMRSCKDKRLPEMELLLQVGASNLISDVEGFTAFGFLICGRNHTPELKAIKSFIDNCRNFFIDYMQGPNQQKGTALTYACQFGRLDVTSLLLEHGANPNLARETDLQNPLAICAGKGFTSLIKAIIQLSKYSINQSCVHALTIAKHYNKSEVVSLLEQYMQQQKISTVEKSTEAKIVFSKGASIDSIMSILNQSRVTQRQTSSASNWSPTHFTPRTQTNSQLEQDTQQDLLKKMSP